MNKAYLQSMREHLSVVKVDIDSLQQISAKKGLNSFEYLALERTLQILVESCIGIAKHLCKEKTKLAPADAYQAFERLETYKILTSEIKWRRIIGLRNALVHDYLNIDKEIVKAVIDKGLYKHLFIFAEQALGLLNNEKINL